MVSWLTQALRRKKGEKVSPPFWECLPHQVRCPSCQMRPALADSAGNWCQICSQKRIYQGRYAWFQRYVQEGKPPKKYFNEQPIHKLEHPQDLSELGQACRAEPGYIGFIYLDGDGIGQLLQKIARREHYRSVGNWDAFVSDRAGNDRTLQPFLGTTAHRRYGDSVNQTENQSDADPSFAHLTTHHCQK